MGRKPRNKQIDKEIKQFESEAKKQKDINLYEKLIGYTNEGLLKINNIQRFISFDNKIIKENIKILSERNIHLAIEYQKEIKNWLKRNNKYSWIKKLSKIKVSENSDSDIILHALGYGAPIKFYDYFDGDFIKAYRYVNPDISNKIELIAKTTDLYSNLMRLNNRLEPLNAEIQALINLLHKIHFNDQEYLKELLSSNIKITEYLRTKKALLNRLSKDETKLYFEHDVKLVKQYPEWYPILFNYFEYIRDVLLKATGKPSSKRDVFRIISRYTNGFKNVKTIESYYNNTFKDLDPLPI